MTNSKTRPAIIGTVRHGIRRYGAVLVAFLLGIVWGGQRHSPSCLPSTTSQGVKAGVAGSVHRLSETPLRATSHEGVSKRQFLESFAVPHVAGYSVASIQPGQQVDTHQHETMHEFFYVTKGTGFFVINGNEVRVAPGSFLHIAPHEAHSIRVPHGTPDGDMEVLFSGVTIE